MNNPFMSAPQMNTLQLAQDFRQFAIGFKGDPKAEVQKLLDSGKMTQEQYQFYMSQIQQRFPFMGR